MPIIICKRITKSYSASFSGRVKKKALDSLSFEVDKKEVFGIVGPNGAGKSTIIKILMGFVRPDHGSAELVGLPVSQYTCRNTLGYLPENPSLYQHLSLADHLRFSARTTGMTRVQTKIRIDEIAETVGLSHAVHTPIRSFSKGMTQRAGLAYALFLQPEILILDEPMSGLDPFGRKLVVDIVRESQASGTTILLCSHILTDVERICSRIAVMNKSKIVAMTKPEDLKSSLPQPRPGMTRLESFFFDILREGKS